MEEHIDDKILSILNNSACSIKAIACALDENRNRVQVHINKLIKWRQINVVPNLDCNRRGEKGNLFTAMRMNI